MKQEEQQSKTVSVWTECRWCRQKIKINAISCRHCHTKQRPCGDCKGPVGRATDGPICFSCKRMS